MSSISKILLIEDDDIDARQIMRIIRSGLGEHVDVDWVADKEIGRQEIAKNAHDVCLVDYKLGKDDGVALIQISVSQGCRMPLILLTGMSTGVIDVMAMEAGASDYLVKDDLTAPMLIKSCQYALARQQILNSLVETKELLSQKNIKLSELYDTAHQFVDNVSHEFRTPLTVIKEFSSILSDGLGGEVNDEQKRYLGIIQDRTSDLSIMIDDMLDISRMESGLLGVSRKNISVSEIFDAIGNTLERKAASSDVEISIEIAEELDQVFCDPENIARVISNLGFNAIKFSGRDGQVKILADMSVDGSEVVISVSDNGPGISEDHIKEIFERFKQVGTNVRASTKGFGLGLNIALELVHMNLGTLSVESTFGEGSKFFFGVPIYNPDIIVEKFSESLLKNPSKTSCLAMFDVTSEISTNEQQSAALNSFLQRQLRRTDLLLPYGEAAWLLCVQINAHEIGALAKRYHNALEELNSDVLNDELPVLSYKKRGFWNLLTERDKFVKEFLAPRRETD